MTRLSDFAGGRSLAQIYDEGWGPAVLEPFIKDLNEYISADDAVLDVGCGTGLSTFCASEAAGPTGRVVGIDPTAFLLDMARSKSPPHPIEWIDGGVENMPFDHDSFDVVLCNQALQYTADPLVGVKAMAAVAKPGGTVAISVWSPTEKQIPMRDFEDLIARHIGPDVSTLHAFSFGGLELLQSLVEEANLGVASAKTVAHPTTYKSVAACVELLLAGAGRALSNGTLGMGLFDLEDPAYVQGVEDLIAELEEKWIDHVRDGQLEVPYFTDMVVGRKE